MKRLLLFLSVILIIFTGCTKDELSKSVFLEDPANPGLPAYSEWGYNTFGCYYDRDVFVSNNTLVPAKVIVSNDTMSFILDGQDEGNYNNYYYGYKHMAMTFKLPGFSPAQYTGLIVLNDTTLNLQNPLYQVTITLDTTKYIATILSGDLNFKRAQNLQVDKNPIEVILSGYFDFKALVNGSPVTFSNGRFDVGISPDNFYTF